MIKLSFEEWYDEDIEEVFGIERLEIQDYQVLSEWLNTESQDLVISTYSKQLQRSLIKNVDTWNEEELKMIFIGPLLAEINFDNYPYYKVFLERKAEIKTENIETQGKIDWMVAQGRNRPKMPFFFLHEYKKESGGRYNPLGQLLIAMLYAQSQNQNNLPIYGVYVVGRMWFFVALSEKQYAVSRSYDATQDDDFPLILNALKTVKKYIHQYLDLD